MKLGKIEMCDGGLNIAFDGENAQEQALLGCAFAVLKAFPDAAIAAGYIKAIAVALGFVLPKVG